MAWETVNGDYAACADYKAAGRVAVDTETFYDEVLEGTALTKFIAGNKNNRPFGMSLFMGENTGYWVTDNLHRLRGMLTCEEIEKIMHNSKYDIQMFLNIGIRVKGKIWDTMLMIHLINEEQFCRTPDGKFKKSKRLKDLAYHFLGDDGHLYEDRINEIKKQISNELSIPPSSVSYKMIEERAPQEMADYGVSDTAFDKGLFDVLYPMLIEQNLLEAYDRDMAATLALIEVERNGMRVDMTSLLELKESMVAHINLVQNNIFKFVHKVFNINSDDELVAVFAELGVTWEWFTEKGNLSTDAKVMSYLCHTHGFFNIDKYGDEIWEEYTHDDLIGLLAYLVIDYRKNSKTVSTFLDGLLTYSDTHNRVHCDFNVCPRDDGRGGTVTGRISSSQPNFQNLPKRGDKRVRRLLIPEEESILVEFDYAQQEYRLLAHYSQDENLITAIKNGWDVHQATAAIANHCAYEDVTPKQRQKAKATNFGLVYGLGLAEYSASMGHKIDAPLYNMGGKYMRDKGIKPWNATLEAVLPIFADNQKAQDAIRYYFSEEATRAIELAKVEKDQYFARFPKVQLFLQDVIETCKTRGYIKTWTGRRRHFINPKQEAYKAPNALIQGGCGDITKEKLAKCQAYLTDGGYYSTMVNTVHDSIVFNIKIDELFLVEELRKIMDDNNFRVPITCDIEWSEKSWGDMKKYKSIESLREELAA